MPNQKIIFPEKFSPSNSPVFVHNEIEINATPGKVWFWLTNAATWHDWYFNASKVKLVNEPGGHLLEKTKFTWKTFGADLKSEVQKFVPNERLTWDAKGPGILAYHARLIIPTTKDAKQLLKNTIWIALQAWQIIYAKPHVQVSSNLIRRFKT
ncbi:MAG: hypothetical protein JWR61_1161 [Ferruginibacter sp.]|uniref:SRPBCC family protein n=1 Tax=Ferruginibacter sp. TaxID=1940288 RepID=UPI002658953E|nr:SRPBCC family protein [Ferruginibacter sp.]MDB5276206.1 hypothetical protein [Ferruginibacter sp.]